MTDEVPREAVICEAVRTPVGRFGGALRSVSAAALAALVIAELVQRAGLSPQDVDDVILGQCYPSGEAPAIGRAAAPAAGLPVQVSGVQVDRRCGSGLQAGLYACMPVPTGAAGLGPAGGLGSLRPAGI